MLREVRQPGCANAKIVEVIKTIDLRGDGTETNPVREVTQYWDFKGRLLWSDDVYND